MNNNIYFDNAATTQTDQRVIDVMLPYFNHIYGNPSSLHSFGTLAKETIEKARTEIATTIGANANEIYFTSGGTESNNFALKGIAFGNLRKGNHIIVSAIEHDCVLNTCKWLEEQGFFVTYIPVDRYGLVDLEILEKAINSKTILVSIMHANNEIGTIEPVNEVGMICHKAGVYFHSDACQSFGKIPIDVNTSNIDLLTINSHKIYGPKGIGALYIRKGTNIAPLLHGGGQESGIRSSTENIPGIVGFAKAASICYQNMNQENARLLLLQNSLKDFLFEHFDNVYINGHNINRLPGHLNFSFHGLEGETIRLLFLLDEMGIAVSAGSACSSNYGNPASHVLQAIGLNPFEARGAIRLSFGRFNTDDEITLFKQAITKTINVLNPIFS